LVGLEDKLIVWNEERDYEMYQIINDDVYSIERVISNDKFILNTCEDGLKILTINDLDGKQFTIQKLLNVKNENKTD
jgi:hypothetical protein